MADVRLTATNPEDSTVVPVACNAKGELKLEEIPDQSFDGNLNGDLTVSGGASFAGGDYGVTSDAIGYSHRNSGSIDLTNYQFGYIDGGGNRVSTIKFRSNGTIDIGGNLADNIASSSPNTRLNTDGSATFAGDVTVGSRNKQWMIVESGGIAHLVEQTAFQADVGTADLVTPSEKAITYPELRNLPQELDQLRGVVNALLTEVQRVEEKLRMAPEGGWPVWDGSD